MSAPTPTRGSSVRPSARRPVRAGPMVTADGDRDRGPHPGRLPLPAEGGCPGVEGGEQARQLDRACRRRQSRAASEPVLAVSDGPKQPKQPRPTAGHRAPQPARVTGPRHGVPSATSMHTVPRPLHSWQTEWPGMARAAPGQGGGDDLQQLAAVDRAAVELEVDVHVRRDRRRGLERRDVLGVGVDGADVVARGGEVAERLDPPGGGARADGDEPSASWPRISSDALGSSRAW